MTRLRQRRIDAAWDALFIVILAITFLVVAFSLPIDTFAF